MHDDLAARYSNFLTDGLAEEVIGAHATRRTLFHNRQSNSSPK